MATFKLTGPASSPRQDHVRAIDLEAEHRPGAVVRCEAPPKRSPGDGSKTGGSGEPADREGHHVSSKPISMDRLGRRHCVRSHPDCDVIDRRSAAAALPGRGYAWGVHTEPDPVRASGYRLSHLVRHHQAERPSPSHSISDHNRDHRRGMDRARHFPRSKLLHLPRPRRHHWIQHPRMGPRKTIASAPPTRIDGTTKPLTTGLLPAHRTMQNTAGKVAMAETLDAPVPGRGTAGAVHASATVIPRCRFA